MVRDKKSMRIRREFTLKDWVDYGSISKKASKFLEKAVQNHCTIVISGPLGTGKTSLLNALGMLIAEDEKVVAVDSGFDVRLNRSEFSEQVLHKYYPSVQEDREDAVSRLFRESWMEAECDRLLVGDFRQGGVYETFLGIQEKKSVLGVVHSLEPKHTLKRLLNIATESPLHEQEKMHHAIQKFLHVIVHVERREDKKIRVASISQLALNSGTNGVISVEPIFEWHSKKGLKRTTVPLSEILTDKLGGKR